MTSPIKLKETQRRHRSVDESHRLHHCEGRKVLAAGRALGNRALQVVPGLMRSVVRGASGAKRVSVGRDSRLPETFLRGESWELSLWTRKSLRKEEQGRDSYATRRPAWLRSPARIQHRYR